MDLKSEWSDIKLIDVKTGEEIGSVNPLSKTTFLSEEDAPINIHNSYSFQCEIDSCRIQHTTAFRAYRRACDLADRLNDLIEEYHVPGTPRRERRAIQREFNKILKNLQNICDTHDLSMQLRNV